MKRSIIRKVGDDQYQAAVVETLGVHLIAAARRAEPSMEPVPWAGVGDDWWTGPVRPLSERAILEAERDATDCHLDAPIERKQWWNAITRRWERAP